MNKTKRIPFDINKAKAGARVVTREGYHVRLGLYDVKNGPYKIVGAVENKNGLEDPRTFTLDGKHDTENAESPYDLFIEEEVERRLMTQQELSDWLRDSPHEHREFMELGIGRVCTAFDFMESEADDPVTDILIRQNHGKWQEPLIDEE